MDRFTHINILTRKNCKLVMNYNSPEKEMYLTM